MLFQNFPFIKQKSLTDAEGIYNNAKTLFDEKKEVKIGCGDCSQLKTNALGKDIDLYPSLCLQLKTVSPIIQIILTLFSQLSLLFLAIKLYKWAK